MWKTSKEVKDLYGICSQTLHNWRKNGTIKYKKINKRNFLYYIENNNIQKYNVLYARVSTTKQKKDLDKQIKILQEYMNKNGIIVNEIYKDIGSGMNGYRKDFNRLISDVLKGKIQKVFITYKDRLIRFGFETIESIFLKNNVEIIVLNKKENGFQEELTQDLISIIHHFSMKLYSNRRKTLKNFENELIEFTEN